MTDITLTFNSLVKTDNPNASTSARPLSTETADEFLKEAYRINSHITSLLQYLQSIRPSYLSTATQTRAPKQAPPPTPKAAHSHNQSVGQKPKPEILSSAERDNIDSSTSHLLRTLSTSITNLSAAESLRQETFSSLLDRKYGRPSARATKLLFKWAGGASLASGNDGNSPRAAAAAAAAAAGEDDDAGKSTEQIADEGTGRALKGVRESVVWFLSRRLEVVVEMQRDMVERRIERAREKEKSVLYKASTFPLNSGSASGSGSIAPSQSSSSSPGDSVSPAANLSPGPSCATLEESEVAAIEAELSPEQLQLFAEENDSMVRYYEDTLGKVQNAEKSLLEISSLQQTLVSHLSTQEEYITQLVGDVVNTETNIGQGNRELKRATERRSAAQAVFWGTVGLCTWLVVWDLVF